MVDNWLSIVNLDLHHARRFHVRGYSALSVSVPPMGRIDLDLKPQSWPGQFTFAALVDPLELDTPYIAAITRYGSAVSRTGARAAFSNSHYLVSETAAGALVPISLAAGGEAFVETVSFDEASHVIGYVFTDDSGLSHHGERHLPGTVHFDIGEYFTPNQSGYARIERTRPVFVQSVTYFRDPATGLVTASHSTPGTFPRGTTFSAGFNTFLGQVDWLRTANIGAPPQRFTASILNSSHAPISYDIGPYAHYALPIDHPTLGSAGDSIGTVSQSSLYPNTLLAELLRLQPSPRGHFNFSMSIPMR